MLILFLALACDNKDTGSDSDAVACDTAPNVTWDNWGDGFFATYCRACHSATSPDRRGAPETINFDTEAEVARLLPLVRSVVLDEASMPIGGGVYEDDLTLLDVYLSCGL